jgi:hypothetical protein
MKEVKIRENSYQVKDNWDEISIGEYVNLVDLYSSIGDTVEEIFYIKFVSLLTGVNENDLMELYEDELTEMTSLMDNFSLDTFQRKESKVFNMNDMIYSYVSPSKLTVGEKISLKLLEKNSKTPGETWLNLLSILIRPATENVDEFNNKTYECNKFDGDINILNQRKELIKNNVLAVNAMYVIEAFMPGSE